MKQFVYKIVLKQGLHARPSALLAEKVRGLDSKVTLSLDGKESDCSSMPSIIALKAKKDSEVLVTVEGNNEDADATFLENVFKENF